MNAKSVFVIMRQSPRSFVEKLDFRTSLGTRVKVIVTDLAIYHLVDGEMQLDSLHPGVTLDQVKDSMGWEPRVNASVAETAAPTDSELRMIREDLDPGGVYTR